MQFTQKRVIKIFIFYKFNILKIVLFFASGFGKPARQVLMIFGTNVDLGPGHVKKNLFLGDTCLFGWIQLKIRRFTDCVAFNCERRFIDRVAFNCERRLIDRVAIYRSRGMQCSCSDL